MGFCMAKIKEGDTVTIDLSGIATEVHIKAIGFDGTLHGVIDDKTAIQFKIGNAQIPKRNIFKSFFSMGKD